MAQVCGMAVPASSQLVRRRLESPQAWDMPKGTIRTLRLPARLRVRPFTAADTVIKYTYYGDANFLDGSVDLVDVGKWSLNFTGSGGSTTKTWSQGDWDYDGDVDLVDVGRWSLNFTGSGGGVLSDPVDGGFFSRCGGCSQESLLRLGLLGLAAVPMLRRRRRN